MQWFTHDQLNELKEKDGLLLTNVHGGKVGLLMIMQSCPKQKKRFLKQ